MFFPENYNRSQDLPVAYHDAGQFYWGSLDTWIKKLLIFFSYSSKMQSKDIDTTSDWERAEFIMKTNLDYKLN